MTSAISVFPDEVTKIIFSFLDDKSLGCWRRVSKKCSAIASDDLFWKPIADKIAKQRMEQVSLHSSDEVLGFRDWLGTSPKRVSCSNYKDYVYVRKNQELAQVREDARVLNQVQMASLPHYRKLSRILPLQNSYQVWLLQVADGIALCREVSKYATGASAVWLVASPFFQQSSAAALTCTAISGVCWLMTKTCSGYTDAEAQRMLKHFMDIRNGKDW